MLTFTYEVKGSNVQTSFFIEYLEREASQSKHYGLEASISTRSSDALTVTLKHADQKGIEKYVSWLKSASKGVSKVQSVRKM